MIASPSDLEPLDVERERRRVEDALAGLGRDGLVELTWLEGQTWRDLQRAMRGGPWHVFHFVGHGSFDTNRDEGIIVLVDDDGRSRRLMAGELARLLAVHRTLRLAVLNACEGARGGGLDIFSSTASILVRRGIPAVLAMQYEITDRAAVEFARGFYEAVADGLPVDAAVSEARQAVSLAVTNTVEWGTPVLHMRAPDGLLFNLAAATPAVPTPATPAPPAQPTPAEASQTMPSEVGKKAPSEPEVSPALSPRAALPTALNEGMARPAETISVKSDPWSTVEDDYGPGELVEALVNRVSDFGAFVGLRTGVDGLIHISELAWFPVAHPSDVVKVGQQVEVRVLNIDKQRKHIDLSLKRAQPNPWSTAPDDYKAGELVEAVVTRVSDFGAFTRLRTGVEGLLHVSEMADVRPDHPQSLVAPGDLLLLRVLRVEPQRELIDLSLRQVSEGEWAEWAMSYREKHAAQIAEEATIAETADGFMIEDDITTAAAVLTLTSPIRMEFVRIPAGEFLMGSDPAVDKDARDNEQPQHRVHLPDFYIGKVPVTNEQYAAFVRTGKHRPPAHWSNGQIPGG